jgi:hypothetical protein
MEENCYKNRSGDRLEINEPAPPVTPDAPAREVAQRVWGQAAAAKPGHRFISAWISGADIARLNT